METPNTSEKRIADYSSYDELIEDIKKIMDIYEASGDTDFAVPYSVICSIKYSADEFGYIQVDIDGTE